MTLLEIIFGGLITQFLGLNTRYYFFKIFNKNLKKGDFENDKEDIGSSFSQGFYNFFIGLIVFILLSFGVVYLLDLFHLL
ncbi:hypothetical protein F3J23_07525 [Chryseobacterium sp. Tr-659]|uniref:hypothetical protein n=1 Tax=unclassified Chryseobacterium TaxID=2593645 RepID=UPI001422F47B|nr:hypothetical protein [Chryseobacterium sp. Tr-659]NIF05289.1 hypothetical protein [Chryseobacterium sp. Tr-659]